MSMDWGKDCWNCGPFTIRRIRLPAGEIIPGHTHNFDHFTVVMEGTVLIEVSRELVDQDGRPIMVGGLPSWLVVARRTFIAGVQDQNYCTVLADDKHQITAITDAVIWCQFPHLDAETKEVIPRYTGFEAAYV